MVEERSFTTPRGSVARLLVRPGTNDAMMAESAIVSDEYGLADIDLGSGVAVDVGAHIGMVAISLALDNPEARVIAVEPVPDNHELLVRNVELNGVADRVSCIYGATGGSGADFVVVAYGFEGGELETMHRFVGNQPMPDDTPQTTVMHKGISLEDLRVAAGGKIRLLVIDAEGAEYGLLKGKKQLSAVEEIRGEYHRGYAELAAQLAATHEVEQRSGDATFGAFVARRSR